jgi:hypothetical protein
MSTNPSSDKPSTSLSVMEQIDAACDRFEAEWRAGSRPQIQAYLAQASEEERRGLLRELLRLDIAYRRKGGEQPRAGDYQALAGLLEAGLLDSLLGPAPRPEPKPAATPTASQVSEGDSCCHSHSAPTFENMKVLIGNTEQG